MASQSRLLLQICVNGHQMINEYWEMKNAEYRHFSLIATIEWLEPSHEYKIGLPESQ